MFAGVRIYINYNFQNKDKNDKDEFGCTLRCIHFQTKTTIFNKKNYEMNDLPNQITQLPMY